MNRLGIYVQVPFCQTKCTYCNFHTGVVSSARFAPYVACVCSEIAGHRGLYEADGIRGNFACELTEVTLEADPETVTEEKAAAWVRAGINRVSFGVQSFCDEELKAAGRMHRRTDIY